MTKYIRLTETGLNKISEARNSGTYIEVMYYVPVYDINADTTLFPTSAFDIDNYTNFDDEVPSGEVFWNIPDWESSYYNQATADNDYLINLSATGGPGQNGTYEYTSYLNSSTVIPTEVLPTTDPITTLGMSYIYDARDRVSTPAESGDTKWVFDSQSTMKTSVIDTSMSPADTTKPTKDYLYSGVEYSRKIDNNNHTVGGDFFAYVSVPKGSLRFNKIGWYAVMKDESGVIATNPFLFAQTYYPEPIYIYGSNTPGMGSEPKGSVIKLELNAVSSAGSLTGIIYDVADEYWTRVMNSSGQYGLHYTGQVYISNKLGFESTSTGIIPRAEDVGVAKQLISTYYQVNKQNKEEEQTLPQLALQNVDYPVAGDLYSIIRRATFRVTADGDLEFDMYGGCRPEDNFYIMPKNDTLISLGREDRRWGRLYLSDRLEIVNGDYDDVLGVAGSTNTYNQFYIRMGLNDNLYNATTHTYLAKTGYVWFNNTQVRVGPHYNTITINDELPNPYYTYSNISNDIYVARDDLGNKHLLEHDLGIRSTQNINMYVQSIDYLNINEFGSNVPGVIDDNEWNTPRNIDAYLESLTYYGKYSRDFSNADYTNLLQIIAGIRDASSVSEYDASLNNYTYTSKLMNIKNAYMLKHVNGLITDEDWKYITSTYSISNSEYTTFSASGWELTSNDTLRKMFMDDDNIGINKSLYLTSSKNIWTFGDIVPMIDGVWNLGAEGRAYRTLYITNLVGSNGLNSTSHYINVSADLYPTHDGQIIGRVPSSLSDKFGGITPRWKYISADYIGTADDKIEFGFFNNIYSNQVIAKTISMNDSTILIDHTGVQGLDFVGRHNNKVKIGYFKELYVDHLVMDDTSKIIKNPCV